MLSRTLVTEMEDLMVCMHNTHEAPMTPLGGRLTEGATGRTKDMVVIISKTLSMSD